MLAKKHPEIREAVLTLKQMSWLEERRMIKEQLSLWEADDQTRKQAAHAEGMLEGEAKGLLKGKAEGLLEGEVKGKAEERLEIARRMKARGRTVEEIAEDTGLSAREIARL